MATISSNGTGGGLSNVTTTWAGGIIPVEGDKVTVVVGDTVTPTGTHIWGDDTTSAITISGTLKASRVANSSLQCKGDLVTSAATTATIDYGRRSTSDPIPAGITATLILNYSAALSNFKYGLYIADTSNFYACGQTTNPNTTLTAGIAVAATTCVVADITGWVVGDTFVLGVSDGTYNHYDKKVITTITAGAGTTGTLTWTGGTTYAHSINCPVGNISSNVTIKNFNTSNTAYFCMRHTSTASNNRREIDYVSFQYAGSNSVLTTTQTFITAGTNVVTTPLRTCTNNKFFNTNFNVGIFIHGWNSGGFAFDNSVFFGDSGSSGAMYYTASGTFCELKNSVFYYSAGPCLLSAFSQGGQGCLYTDIKFASSASNLILWTNGDGGLFTRCTFHSVPSSFGVSISAGSGNFVNCNFFYSGAITNSTPVAWGTITTPSNLFSVGSAGSKGTWVASDSYFGTASTSLMNLPFLVTLNPQWSLTLINKNALVTSQEIYTPKGITIRDNSNINRSLSSEKINPTIASTLASRVFSVPTINGVSARVIGYLYYDATYTNVSPPSVTLSGLGITPQTYTAGSSTVTWYKFDLSATQTSGNDGNLTLTASGQSTAITGNFWVDGVVDSPFVTSSRHYGFLFDTNIFRSVNPYITQTTEATAGAYTGIAISGSTITITSNHSIQEIYDYTQWYVCQTANLGVTPFFTTADGSNYVSTYNLTLSGGSITGTGTINLGIKVLVRTTETSTLPITYSSGASVFTSISVSGYILGSRIRINNTTDSIELYNAIPAGASLLLPIVWTANKAIDVRVGYTVGLVSYLAFSTSGTFTNIGAIFTISQQLDTTYQAYAIDGSTVTEFASSFPTANITLVSAGTLSVKRFYAWFKNQAMTSQGIVYYFGGLTAINQVTIRVNASTVPIQFNNPTGTNARFIDVYIYRDDGGALTSSGPIQFEFIAQILPPGSVTGLTTAQNDKLMNFTGGIVGLSKNVADFGKLQEKQLQEVHERSKIILDKVDIISENTSEKLDIQPILDKIDLSIPNLSNISSSLGTIKTQNTKLSQKIGVVIDNQEIEIINQEENDKKLIEIYKQEAQLIEKDLEDIYKKEADQIEQELKNIYKQEADQIEKELSNQL